MPDPRFFRAKGPITIGEALAIVGASADAASDASAEIERVAELSNDDLAGAVVFAERAAAIDLLRGRRIGLCLAPLPDDGTGADFPIVRVDDPRRSFAALAARLHEERRLDDAGEDPRIGAGARIHATAVIGAGAVIGPDVAIGPFAVIGPGVVLGAGVAVGEGASILCAILDDAVLVGAGARIGGAGFGFYESPGGLLKAPQLGRALIGEAVEIGANACIHRGALGDTVIGRGTKIDALVHIGHNVKIGENGVMTAQVGIAGSTTIGKRAQLGGQAGIADHLKIGDDARIAAKAGVMRDVPAGETWGGYPARALKQWLRETAELARLARRKKGRTRDAG